MTTDPIPMQRVGVLWVRTRRGFLEPDQIAAICRALPEDVWPVVKFAYATGWRTRSEVQPLEW